MTARTTALTRTTPTNTAKKTALSLAMAASLGLVLGLALVPATAQTTDRDPLRAGNSQTSEARDTLQEARKVVQRMQADPTLARQLQSAKGVFVVPNFARGGVGIVAKGGEGVVLSRLPDGSWSPPAFYNMGGVSVGLSAGASAGQMAFLLMTDTARQAFDSTNNFSLNADAGLSVVNWSARAQGSMGKGEDVIVWSDTSGLFAGASVGVSDVFVDNEENRALYGPQANAQSILSGRVQNVPAAAAAMRQALASNRSGASRGTEMAAQNSGAGGRGDLSAPGEDNRPQRQARADRN